MRKVLIVTALIITSKSFLGQKRLSKIDNINSGVEVENLIHSFGKNYLRFKLRSMDSIKNEYGLDDYCGRVADSLNITKAFYKADIDNNGFTDILAIGEDYEFAIYVVLNYGQDSLVLNKLTRKSFQDCTFPDIISDTVIRYYYMSDPDFAKGEKPSLQQKDLVFKFGDFVELNRNPKAYDIEKIEYSTTMCFGTCPVYQIKINKDKTAIFNAERFN